MKKQKLKYEVRADGTEKAESGADLKFNFIKELICSILKTIRQERLEASNLSGSPELRLLKKITNGEKKGEKKEEFSLPLPRKWEEVDRHEQIVLSVGNEEESAVIRMTAEFRAGEPEQYRNFNCTHYDECLDVAAKRLWPGFSCKRCPFFGEGNDSE